jgi:hypothetical protein
LDNDLSNVVVEEDAAVVESVSPPRSIPPPFPDDGGDDADAVGEMLVLALAAAERKNWSRGEERGEAEDAADLDLDIFRQAAEVPPPEQ